jgi:hypothetical protein
MLRIQGKTREIPGTIRNWLIAGVAVLAAACGAGDGADLGGGPTPNGCSDSTCGTALLTVTDAPGDFQSYTVDVTSLQLKKANGTMVETLPAATRIDFAQLVELDEVLSAGQIPEGEYVAATLSVDYTDADIVVEDAGGAGVAVSPVNASGQALGKVQLTVQLDNRNHLRITPRRISHLAFDLDLAASNTVDLTAHTVTVSPFVLASVTPPDTRDTRLRGALASVDVAGASYTVNIRPFHEGFAQPSELVVHTTSTTSFEINGQVYAGSAGLTQLATLTDKPMTVAFGTIDRNDHVFTAKRVLAGTSIEDSNRDFLSGVVLARAGNTLTVGGVHIGRRDERFGFRRGTTSVTIGAQTKVTRDGQSTGTMSIADISVGQRIEVLGASGTGAGTTFDATNGRVRLAYTRIFGTVTAAAAGSLTMRLTSIDGRDPARFNFTGTAATPAQDADPLNYEVATGNLNVAGIPVASYTRLFGFVSPFGAAPPDFQAQTFLDFTDTKAGIALNWGRNGSTTPFLTISSAGLAVDLVNTALVGNLELGGRIIDVHTLQAGLTIKGSTDDHLIFAIAHRGSSEVQNFSTFADFTAALGTGLNGTRALVKLVAEGQLDAPGGSFTARRLLVVLSD